MYDKRVKEIESMQKAQLGNLNPQNNPEDQLINQMLGGSNIPSGPSWQQSNQSLEDQQLLERFQKLKTSSQPQTPTSENLAARFEKMTGRQVSSERQNIVYENPSEEDQIQDIINSAIDSAKLQPEEDDLQFSLPKAPNHLDSSAVKTVNTSTNRAVTPGNTANNNNSSIDNKIGGGNHPNFATKLGGNNNNFKFNAKQEKKKKKSNDSDDDEGFDSDEDDDLSEFDIKPGDSEWKIKEKNEMKKRFLQEREKKRLAFEQWKKENRV